MKKVDRNRFLFIYLLQPKTRFSQIWRREKMYFFIQNVINLWSSLLQDMLMASFNIFNFYEGNIKRIKTIHIFKKKSKESEEK